MKSGSRCGTSLLLTWTASLMVIGCVERQVVYVPAYNTPTGTNSLEVVSQAPPAPRVEVIPPPPGPDYYWVPGYWNWNGTTWIWIGGSWVIRPWHGAVWVGGNWRRHNPGWVWVRGHWR